MRYAYAITTALLIGGAASSLVFQFPASAQTAQNEPGTIAASAPKAGAPMSFADMVAKLQPAVVNVSTKQKVQVQAQENPLLQLFGQQDPNGGGAPITREGQSLGSGFIISPDGYIVTNAHVISAAATGAKVESITITLFNRKEYTARVIGSDTASDLALLKVDAAGLPFVKFGDSTKARVGDWVIAIGEPFGLGGTVTAGIVSALNRVTGPRAYDRFIQTDAAINKGNSGGPMFDLSGNVIGINSQIYSPSEGSVGIGFAIPAETARPIIDTMMKGGKVLRGYLGVGPQPIDEDIAATTPGLTKDHGELINRVEPAGPAAKAGLKQGDAVVAVNGQEVNPEQGLSYQVGKLAPGSSARLDIIRDGKPMTITATIGTRPTEEELAALTPGGNGGDGNGDGTPGAPELRASSDLLGISVTALTPGIANNLGIAPGSVSGVVVTNVDPSSDAAAKSLQRGDIISSVNRVAVATPAQMDTQVRAAKAAGRTTILIYITRPRQGSLYLAVKLKG